MKALVKKQIEKGIGLSKSQMCSILGLKRSQVYRVSADSQKELDKPIIEKISRIIEEMPGYGQRRVTHALRQDYQMVVNHKRVGRIMREENLLCKRKRRTKITTTDSRHNYPIFPNLAIDIQTTGINQLWVSDITYIPLPRETGYLALILDAHSRKCVGWAFEKHMRVDLTLDALEMAIKDRGLKKCTALHRVGSSQ